MLRNEALRKFGKHSRSLKCSRLLFKQLYFLGLKLFTEFSCQKRCPKASPALTILKPVVVLTKAEHHLFANEKRMRGEGGGGGGGRCLQGNLWYSPPASMTSRLASVTFKMASKVFIEEKDKNFDLITEILIRFLGFGDFKVPIVIEN